MQNCFTVCKICMQRSVAKRYAKSLHKKQYAKSLYSKIGYDFAISSMFSLTSFLCTLFIHSSLERSSPEAVQGQVFTRLRPQKGRFAGPVVAGKVKAINNACQTTGEILQYRIIISSNDLILTLSSTFECFHVSYYWRALMQKFSVL